MTVVAGVDFGTQSVRVSIVDRERGQLGHGVSPYPVIRRREDPDFATQSHDAHMSALVDAMHVAPGQAGVRGKDVRALALDTTGSTVVPVGKELEPLDDYYLWADHRAHREAAGRCLEKIRRRDRSRVQRASNSPRSGLTPLASGPRASNLRVIA